MIKNILTGKQEEFFLDIYKIALGSMLKKQDHMDSISFNSIINDAVTLSAKSVELLMDDHSIKSMKEIKDKIDNERIDKLFEFPDIIEDKDERAQR